MFLSSLSDCQKPYDIHMEYQVHSLEIYAHYLLKKENELEKKALTNLETCLDTFLAKGGKLQVVSDFSESNHHSIHLLPQDIVYPICSGGVCRSQTLWALLRPFNQKIYLFPPHAARYGWDPYNGKINRFSHQTSDMLFDDFKEYFGFEKSQRFGYENSTKWDSFDENPSQDILQSLTDFYNQNYYGSQSLPEEKKSCRRVYITFANNGHVVLNRLNESNEFLDHVCLIVINSEDIITTPPNHLMIAPRSKEAYANFADLLLSLFDFQAISSD